jgi:hypothetical protein
VWPAAAPPIRPQGCAQAVEVCNDTMGFGTLELIGSLIVLIVLAATVAVFFDVRRKAPDAPREVRGAKGPTGPEPPGSL